MIQMRSKFAFGMILLAIAGCSEQQTGAAPGGPGMPRGPVEVAVLTLKPQSVPRSVELPGRVVALATAEIRPQVEGIVRNIAFKEGGNVAKDDVLYEIDARKFEAALTAADANYKKAQASLTGAEATLERNRRLADTNAVSIQTVEDARTALLEAEASAEAAKADVDTARINLENTKIRAPISGMIGISTVSVGALLTANQADALATIRQVDPIHVDLVDSSANLLRIREQVSNGTLGRGEAHEPTVTLTLENQKPYAEIGTLALADMNVSQTTGTFSIRARFANPDRILLPGMFVRARVNLGVMPNVFLVPQRAVTRNASGMATAYFVSADGKAEQRELVAEDTSGNNWIVTSGVKEGDRVVVDGLQKISPGASVTTVDAKIDDNGVVEQDLGAGKPVSAGAEVSK